MIIPIDMDEVPTSRRPLDESLTYRVVIRDIGVAPKKDKNGQQYLKVDTEVLVPDEWKGRHVGDNYVRIPETEKQLEERLGRKPNSWEKQNSLEDATKLARLVKCFKVPYTSAGLELEKAKGREGMITIKNEEFPEGSGEFNSKVRDYLTSS